MRRRCSRYAAAIEILLEGKDNTPKPGIATGRGDQTSPAQSIHGVTQLSQPRTKATTWRIADAHMSNDFRRMDSALPEIGDCFAAAMQLVPIKPCRRLE